MITNSLEVMAPLAPYTPSANNPWNAQKVLHLYRRTGFGATIAMIDAVLQKTPDQAIDDLIDEAVNKAPNPAPEWANWAKQQFDNAPRKFFEYRNDWRNQMIADLSNNNLRDRLTLFWSNHFVTEDNTYNSPAYMYQYYNILQTYALGNFKDFTRAIGLTNAMLIYLNGFQNKKNKPNENYARELYELFTLGVDNGYTQEDIVETARALTGYNKREEAWGPITFDPDRFDPDEKTVFGQGNIIDYDDVIDVLFDQKAPLIAKFICEKLYKYFVGPVVNQNIVNNLAATFTENNFEIAPVLANLFKSNHFFNNQNRGVIIKSPTDIEISFLKETEFEFPDDFELINKVRVSCANLGQTVLRPVDVAGWQGNRDWVGSTTLTGRWERMNFYVWRAWRHNEEQFRTLAKNIMGGNSNDAALISRTIVNHFLPKTLKSSLDYSQALEIFKDEVPENYFEDGSWNLDWDEAPKQTYRLLEFLIKIPEFQLK